MWGFCVVSVGVSWGAGRALWTQGECQHPSQVSGAWAAREEPLGGLGGSSHLSDAPCLSSPPPVQSDFKQVSSPLGFVPARLPPAL